MYMMMRDKTKARKKRNVLLVTLLLFGGVDYEGDRVVGSHERLLKPPDPRLDPLLDFYLMLFKKWQACFLADAFFATCSLLSSRNLSCSLMDVYPRPSGNLESLTNGLLAEKSREAGELMRNKQFQRAERLWSEVLQGELSHQERSLALNERGLAKYMQVSIVHFRTSYFGDLGGLQRRERGLHVLIEASEGLPSGQIQPSHGELQNGTLPRSLSRLHRGLRGSA